MKKIWSIAAVQLDIAWEDPGKNFLNSQTLLSLLNFPVDLIVFPETFSTGYTMNSKRFAEQKFSASETFLSQIAREKEALVGGGWIQENGSAPPLNTFSLVEPEGKIHRYHKAHPFSFAGEEKFYTAGKELVNFSYNGWNISPLICYDLRFPEAFRKQAGQTDLYIIIANWPDDRIEHWSALLKARAIENQAYVLAVNRVGSSGKKQQTKFSGRTSLYTPFGDNLFTHMGKEGIMTAEIDWDHLQEQRNTYPFLKDRKVWLQ